MFTFTSIFFYFSLLVFLINPLFRLFRNSVQRVIIVTLDPALHRRCSIMAV